MKLAIKGHKTRGKEVIQLLEMLGGVNHYGLEGTTNNCPYYIYNNKIHQWNEDANVENVIVFTLEEFEKKFPYKVGDKVTLDKSPCIITEMYWDYDDVIYYVKGDDFSKGVYSTDKDLQPYKEETMEEDKKAKGYCTEEPEDSGKAKKIAWFTFWDNDFADEVELYLKDRELVQKEGKWFVVKKNSSQVNLKELERKLDEALEKETKESLEEFFFGDPEPQPKAPILSNRYDYAEGKCGYVIPDGYEFDCIEEGFQTEIILKPKKPTYPKTYEECCEVIDYKLLGTMIIGYKAVVLKTFQKLLICRDAYWKIAGAEMGLDEPWEPDWRDSNFKYCLKKMGDNIEKVSEMTISCILAFPTEEMRDAFFDNFNELIEQCKELL